MKKDRPASQLIKLNNKTFYLDKNFVQWLAGFTELRVILILVYGILKTINIIVFC